MSVGPYVDRRLIKAAPSGRGSKAALPIRRYSGVSTPAAVQSVRYLFRSDIRGQCRARSCVAMANPTLLLHDKDSTP
jgi:hypothetical protein